MSNPQDARGGTDSCTGVHLNRALTACLRKLFPRKTWLHVIALTGISERSAKYRMSEERPFTGDEIARLLRSEHGLDVLAAIMGGARPMWFRRLLQQRAVSDARRFEQVARRRLQEALDADRDLTAAIARADALLVCDADFHRPHADALGAMAGLPRRAMASGGARG